MQTRHLELGDHLTALAQEVRGKREHSRLTILATAARMASTVDFLEFRVPDLCKMCGISRATFYLHFSTKDDLFVELMRQLTTLESSLTPSFENCADIEAAVDLAADWYVDVHLANAALFINLTYLQRTNPAITDSWMLRTRQLHSALFGELQRFEQFRALDKSMVNFVLEFFAGGMNSLVSHYRNRPPHNPYVPAEISDAKRAISLTFYRALFGSDPKPRDGVKAKASL
ncbi:MAG: helix-turn-helix domain-containing protein [Sterolibacterium sp.]|jgi:AcrR family transcriptional regulator